MTAKKKSPKKKAVVVADVSRGSGRIDQFRRAHKWRLAFARVAREKGHTLKDLISPARSGDVLKDLARDTSEDVGFHVAYHSVWKFVRSDLLKSYMDGKPPSPEEQFRASVAKQATRPAARKDRSASRVTAPIAVEFEAISRDLATIAERIKALAMAVDTITIVQRKLHAVLTSSEAQLRSD